ncbi:MAG TPA: FAD-linked oxidase C-terminal domain-containing protein [Pyrinomonadaceae bacterium]|nr:FAD-linked oxidase C-terminal domain-containing protein [Pyrinomonadaceae bacterium]
MATSEQQVKKPDTLIDELRDVVGNDGVLSEPEELLVYECDGLPQHKHPPRAVVFPTSTEETSEVLKVLSHQGVSFAPRGAGTGLSGGALAINRGVVIEMARMRDILKIDPENRLAVVQTGLVNVQLSRAVSPYGLYYVPDPSSQPSCTIGGNIAENAGGIHCLKYGTTTDHVLGARVVLSDGSIVDLDGNLPGYDLLGVFVGSEGTFGIATEATLRLLPVPPAIRTLLADFTNVDDASRAVSAIIAAGMLPAALEMMDNEIIRAVEASVFTAGLPVDAQAVLLVELDGIEAGIDDDAEKAETILREHGARSVRRAADENERKKLWAARKGAFGAVGRLSPDIMIQDAVVPRSRLPEVLAETYRISARYKIKLANVFHAGDGNLHPLICFDLRRGDDLERVRQAGREIMETCVRAGGSITGEHGVGLDKSGYLPLIFSEDDMETMLRVRAAFDESGLCNPGKIIPLPRGCGEGRAVATQQVSEPRPVAAATALRQQDSAAMKDPPAHADSSVASVPAKTAPNLRLAERINEVRVMNEIKRTVNGANVKKLVDIEVLAKTEFASDNQRALVITPETASEVSGVLSLARREGLSVVPAGNFPWVDIGNRVTQVDVILSTRRMAKMLRHEPADLVATAEAGLTLTDFQKQLAERGQWLPVDPADDGTATLGGIVATGLSGPLKAGYGALRSFVIGLRAVLADGRSIKAGGQVVKNVAGYDLCKLFTGSCGSLGVITEITFKLRPLPAESRTIAASGLRESLIQTGSFIANQYSPVSVELLSSELASHLAGGTRPGAAGSLVRFAGSARAVVTQTAQALKLLRDAGLHCETYDDDVLLWRGLSSASCQPSGDLSWRALVRPTDLPAFVSDVSELEEDEASHVQLQWHAGLSDGRMRAFARAPVYPDETAHALEQLRQRAENLGGSFVVEKAPIEIKNEFDSWGSFGSATELMKRVKRQLDPENVLSPGRFPE